MGQQKFILKIKSHERSNVHSNHVQSNSGQSNRHHRNTEQIYDEQQNKHKTDNERNTYQDT